MCSGTVVNQSTLDEVLSTWPPVFTNYDPLGTMFPRPDQESEDPEEQYYLDAYSIMQQEGFDQDIIDAIAGMDPRTQDYANELCLVEFEHYEFAETEGTTTFCCQAFIVPDGVS